MSDPTQETKMLAESHGLQFTDCGNGHVQIKGHGQLVNYYPTAKRRTLYSPTLNIREANCTPWDAVSICMKGAKSGMQPKAVREHIKKPRERPHHDFKPTVTNPAGIKHFYSGPIPPWEDEAKTHFTQPHSDRLRGVAHRMRERASRLEVKANELDEVYQQPVDQSELEILAEARARI